MKLAAHELPVSMGVILYLGWHIRFKEEGKVFLSLWDQKLRANKEYMLAGFFILPAPELINRASVRDPRYSDRFRRQ